MLSSVVRDNHKPTLPAARTRTVCVVDPQPDAYREWHKAIPAGDVRLHFVASAEEALRLSRTTSVDLWVVNADLPGLSGIELCGMLKSRSFATPVYVVANEYLPEVERAAWSARATLFGCKPAHVDWLTAWCADRLRHSAVAHGA